MSVVTISRGFRFSTGTLLRDAQLLLGALKDDTVGSPVLVHLSPTFVADFEAQIALVARAGADQSGAIGAMGTLVLSQAEALADYLRLCALARRAARLAFPRQDTLLRGEFQVGAGGSRDLPRALERGRKLLAACERYALELAPYGWSPSFTDVLEQAIEILGSVNREREQVGDGKLGLTVEQTLEANRLYRQCLAVQNVARWVYDGARAAADAATVSARARFLLGEFPQRPSAPAEPLPQTSVSGSPVTAAESIR